MKPVETEHMDAAEGWLLRMRWGVASAADREAFDRWLSVPEHAAAYARAEQLWKSFDRLSGDPRVNRLADQVLLDAALRPRGHGARWAIAASVALIAVGTFGYFSLRSQNPQESYATALGERSTIRLNDGSDVILNSATRLEVKMDSRQRDFKLLQGEAIFTVANDPRRPFSVTAGDGRVTALGTRFQVRHESKRVTVTLLEGRIAVDRGDAERNLQLQPKEQVRFSESSAGIERRAIDPDEVTSWSTGRLQFHSTPLSEVLEEVNRYARVKIQLGDPSLADTAVNGTFEVGDSESLVSALERAFPIKAAARDRDRVFLHRSGAN